MTARTCRNCDVALAADAHWKREFCSAECRYAFRDSQPARKAADAARHRARYHSDAEHREAKRTRRRNEQRTAAGIPLDAPLSNRGRRRLEHRQGRPAMTDPTHEQRDRELELLTERDRLTELADGHDRDLAAILIVRPQLRTTTIVALAADAGPVLLRVLEWVDELLLSRDADDLHAQLELQAQVALATTTTGLAELQ